MILALSDSGHGGQVPDKNGDEIDGFDEGKSYSSLLRTLLDTSTVIYPVDYKKAGIIIDDVSLVIYLSFVTHIPMQDMHRIMVRWSRDGGVN